MKVYVLIALFFVTACSSAKSSRPKLAFIHGAHFDERSFSALLPFFKGMYTTAVRLPGREGKIEELTMEDHGRMVCDSIKSNTVLIGHGLGGAVANEAYGQCPDKIRAIVYVAAVIPLDGEKAFDQLAPRDDKYYFAAVAEDREKGLFVIKDEVAFIDGFAQDAFDNQKGGILSLTLPEPIAPSGDVIHFKVQDYDQLPKYVIITKGDRIITAKSQKKMAARLKNVDVKEFHSGHLPMVTKPRDLARAIYEFLSDL